MILVTGAGGLTGREVARVLAPRVRLRLGLRDVARAVAEAPDAERVRLDFEDTSSFAPALAGVTGVYLLRPPGMARPRSFAPFLAALREAEVRRVVFLSVRGAASNPLLPHHGIERLVEASGLGWTHLRPNDFMQNLETAHRADIRDRDGIWAPAGRGRASWVDVRDLAVAAARVLTEAGHEGRAYTLTGPEALGFEDAARLLSARLGRSVTYRDPSLPRFLRHSRRIGRPLGLALVMSAIYSVQRLGRAAEVTPDLTGLLGHPPGTLARYIADRAACWQAGAVGTEARRDADHRPPMDA
jgi:uncharacterized protein YbjT (DUF2867 family)